MPTLRQFAAPPPYRKQVRAGAYTLSAVQFSDGEYEVSYQEDGTDYWEAVYRGHDRPAGLLVLLKARIETGDLAVLDPVWSWTGREWAPSH